MNIGTSSNLHIIRTWFLKLSSVSPDLPCHHNRIPTLSNPKWTPPGLLHASIKACLMIEEPTNHTLRYSPVAFKNPEYNYKFMIKYNDTHNINETFSKLWCNLGMRWISISPYVVFPHQTFRLHIMQWPFQYGMNGFYNPVLEYLNKLRPSLILH